MFNHICLIILSFFCVQNASAQLQLGARLDNWAGQNALMLNPAAGTTAATGWHINVAGMGGSIANDIIFIEKASVLNVLTQPQHIAPNPRLDWFRIQQPLYYFNFFNRSTTKFFSINGCVNLPSLQLNFQNGSSIATIWNMRFGMGSHNVPALADAYVASAVKLKIKTLIDPFKTGGFAWQEYGLNYAFTIGDPLENHISFGISAKRLMAYQAFFIENGGTYYTRWATDSTQFHNTDLLVGFTDNVLKTPTAQNGGGWSLDMGIQYTIGSGEWDEKPYQMRFSAAVTDFGKLNFTKNAQVHALKTNTRQINFYKDQYSDISTTDPIGDALGRINEDLYGTKGASLKGNQFSMALPTALVMQADVALTPQYFVNLLVNQRLPPNNRYVQSDNIIALTPRYESPLYSVLMPISLLEMKQFRVGLAARLAYLTIGTDNLASLIGRQRLTSGDFYMSLIINSLGSGKLNMKERNGLSLPRGRGQRCYRF